MLGIDARAARITWTVFLILLLIELTWVAREAILIFVLALFFAYMLYPVYRFVDRVTGTRISKGLSLGLVFIGLIAILIVLSAWLGAQIVTEGRTLVEQLPALVQKSRELESIQVPIWVEPYKENVIGFVRQQAAEGATRVAPLLQRALGGVAGAIELLVLLIIVPILSFLFLKDAPEIRDYLLSWVPRKHQPVIDLIFDDMHKLLADYIRALVILSAVTAVTYSVFFSVLGLPYALLLSAVACLLEFIPFAGPAVGIISIILVALFTGFGHVAGIVLFYIVYRIVQDYVIQPQLFASGMELHPLVVLFGALAGHAIGGLWGVFLSVPVLASLRIVMLRAARKQVVE